MITNEKLTDLGLVKIINNVQLSAPLIRFEWVYVYLFDPVGVREKPNSLQNAPNYCCFFCLFFKLIKHKHSTLEKEKSKEIIKEPKLPWHHLTTTVWLCAMRARVYVLVIIKIKVNLVNNCPSKSQVMLQDTVVRTLFISPFSFSETTRTSLS